MKLTLRSKRVLTPDGIFPLDIHIEHGIIRGLTPHSSGDVIDLGNMLLTPGFVDVHSDAIEKELEPRPGTTFPLEHSLMEMDKKLAIAGVTTMFHAIAFETKMESGIRCPENSDKIIRIMKRMNSETLRVDNRVHARFEVSSLESIDVIEQLLKDGLIDFFSVMDHAPGQGQFKDVEKWERFYAGSYGLNREEMNALREKKMTRDHEAMIRLINLAIDKKISIASHDDCNVGKVRAMTDLGVTISEFPLSLEVAEFAKQNGLATGMGAPNVVRGGSQSGNIAAKELIANGLCDYLCSDYHPVSLLNSVYIMRNTLEIPLEQGFAMVTSTPARIAGLSDRGEIAIGKRADIAAIDDSRLPTVLLTVAGGRIVHNMTGAYCNDLYKVS